MLKKTYFIGLKGKIPEYSKNLEHERYLACEGYPIFADAEGSPFKLAKEFYREGKFLVVLEEYIDYEEHTGKPFTDIPLKEILKNAVPNTYVFMLEDK